MLSMLGPLFTWKFALLVAFVLGAIFIYRFFCRFFCPLGAIYGLFNKISLLGMKVEQDKCTNCGLCMGKCKMDTIKVGDHECISCGDCVNVCPTKAISYKGPKILVAKNECGEETSKDTKKRTAIRIVIALSMAALLATALIYYNVVDSATPNTDATQPSDPAFGNQIGEKCYEYDLSVYGSDETISVADLRGKVTVINFWGTWCTPCVAELINEFPLIEQEYGERLAILAIHTYDEYGVDVQKFATTNFPDSNYIIARDQKNDAYCIALGGGDSWPYTVILDEDGYICAVIPRATTYEELKEIIDGILAD